MAKRVLLGKKGSDYGLFISKPGVDVTTTSSAKDLLFNSGATTTASGATSERSFRSGVIVTDTTVTTMTKGAITNLPSTLGSDNNYYIPAYQIVENGVRNPTAGYNETRIISGIGYTYSLESTHISGLPTNSGGGLFELSTSGSGSNINSIEAKLIDASKYEDPTQNSGTYPFLDDRGIASNASASVSILMLRIPCQYGKMGIDALFNTTTQPTGNTSGGGGSGGSPSAPTINSVSRTARATTSPFADTVQVSASNGSNNSGTITYAQSTSTSEPSSGYQTSTDFTQSRGTTRYYWAKQGGVVSTSTSHVSAAVDQAPDSFSFSPVSNATSGSSHSATATMAGLLDPTTASASNGTVSPTTGIVTGTTITASGTAPSSGSKTIAVTVGGVTGNFVISTAAPSDTTPNSFSFTDATGANASTVTTSNTINISGIDATTNVTASGNGTVSVNGGSYTNSTTITNGQSINVRLTSNGTLGTSNFVETTITIGGVTDTWRVTNRNQVTASPPTALTLTQTTNTSGTSQTVTATASGGTGTPQVSNDNSSFHSNGHSFSQNRSGSAVTYYARNVGEANSSVLTATKLVPPVVTLSGIGTFNENSSSKNASYQPTPQRAGGNFNTYSSSWGTVSTSISNNSGGWLSSSITNSSLGYFNLTTSANSTTSARSATVTYTTTTQFGYQHSMTFTYNQAGIAVDTTPDQFTFSDVGDRALNTDTFANDQITGINTATNATYSGDANGSFSVTGISGTYNQSAKSVSNGTQIHVKITSSSSNSTARSATITVGGVSDTFTVTTEAASDSTPDFFNFTDVTNADATTVYQSTITLAGFNTAATASISSSAISGFKVNSGSFGTGSQTVNSGDSITVFVRSAAGSFQQQAAVITVGGVSDTFSVVTGNTGGGGFEP